MLVYWLTSANLNSVGYVHVSESKVSLLIGRIVPADIVHGGLLEFLAGNGMDEFGGHDLILY